MTGTARGQSDRPPAPLYLGHEAQRAHRRHNLDSHALIRRKSVSKNPFLAIAITFALSGCEALHQHVVEHQNALLSASGDHLMAESFVKRPFTPPHHHGRMNSVDIVEVSGPLTCVSEPSVSSAIAVHRSKDELSRDVISKRYVEIATQRGNSVRLYKANVNHVIESLFTTTSKRGETASDMAFIEFNASGRMISALTRSIEIQPSIGGSIYKCVPTSHVWIGRNVAHIERQVGNRVLEDGLIGNALP